MQSVLVLLIYLEPKYTAHDLAACRSMFIIKWVCNAPQVRPCTVMASPCSHRHPKGPQETFHWVASRLLLERYAVRRKPLLSPSIFCFWALVCLPSQRSSRQPSLRSRDQLSWWLCVISLRCFSARSWSSRDDHGRGQRRRRRESCDGRQHLWNPGKGLSRGLPADSEASIIICANDLQ